jgi:hypothetical protein
LSRGTADPDRPTRKSRSTPSFACSTWSTYSLTYPRSPCDGGGVHAARRLHLDVPDEELARRRARWQPPPAHAKRGWVKLYCETVQQADKGVDLAFLVGASGAPVGRESH